jgi:hypothetical protein
MSQSDGSEKSSVRMSGPRPGRISAAGGLVAKTPGVGVAVGGNQFMVAVGSGVGEAVAGMKTGVAFIASNAVQEVKSNVIARA